MKEQERAVWQRVMQAKESPQENSIKYYGMVSMEALQEYSAIQSSRKGKPQDLAGKLLRNEQKIIRCLKGLQILQTGTQLQLPKMPSCGNPDQRMLIRRYHTTRKTMTEYMSRSAESEWGCVFLTMARVQEEQCVLLAQLLGVL